MLGLILVAVVVIFLVRLVFALRAVGSKTFSAGGRARQDGGWINPATGLPMLSGGPYGFDIAGNNYGESGQHIVESTLPFALYEADDFNIASASGMASSSDSIWSSLDPSVRDGYFLAGQEEFGNQIVETYINPATGLPMLSDSPAGFDVGGNLYGFNDQDSFGMHDNSSFGFDSDLSSSSDAFGSGSDWS